MVKIKYFKCLPPVWQIRTQKEFFPMMKYYISQSIFSILFHLSFFFTSFSRICSHKKKSLPISNLILEPLFSFSIKLVPVYTYTVAIGVKFLRAVVPHQGGFWQCLETVLVVTVGRCYWYAVSGSQRPTELRAPQPRIIWLKVAIVLRLGNTDLGSGWVCVFLFLPSLFLVSEHKQWKNVWAQ